MQVNGRFLGRLDLDSRVEITIAPSIIESFDSSLTKLGEVSLRDNLRCFCLRDGLWFKGALAGIHPNDRTLRVLIDGQGRLTDIPTQDCWSATSIRPRLAR